MTSEPIACPRCGFPESAPQLVLLQPTSPCPEFLRSNLPPPESTYVDVFREIAIAQLGVSRIEKKMNDLIRVLDELDRRRQELCNFVADHRGVVATIRKLPNELLSGIFLHCADRPAYHPWNPATDPEWQLVQVCRSWRAVMLSMPRIWSHISILGVFPLMNLRPTTIKTILLLQLERSSQMPLEIGFSFIRRTGIDEEQRISVLEALFSAAHRWQDIRLYLTPSDLQQFHYITSFPQLTALKLLVDPMLGECAFGSVFHDVPLLEEIHYDCESYNNTAAGPHTALSQIQGFPLSQLKKLHLARQKHDFPDILAILQLASNLVEFGMYHCGLRNPFPDQNHYEHSTLPNLVSLDIYMNDDTFLRFLVAPALQRLAISYTPFPDLSPTTVSFISRTGSSLTHLKLHRVFTTYGEELLSVLRLTPYISTLDMAYMHSSTVDLAFVKALTCGPDEQNLVPCLVSLEFEGDFQCGAGPILDMLRSRSDPGPLRIVQLRGKGDIADIDWQDVGSQVEIYVEIDEDDY